MDDGLFQRSVALLRQATDADQGGQTARAVELYLVALDGLVRCHSYEKLPANKALLKDKISQYMQRVEQLKKVATASSPAHALPSAPTDPPLPSAPSTSALEAHSQTLSEGETGWNFSRLFASHLKDAARCQLEDPYLRAPHQLRLLTRLLEVVAKVGHCREFVVCTRRDTEGPQAAALAELRTSCQSVGIDLTWEWSETLHDRCLRLSNGWKILLGRGLDMWQKPPAGSSTYFLGANDYSLRKTMQCEITYLRPG